MSTRRNGERNTVFSNPKRHLRVDERPKHVEKTFRFLGNAYVHMDMALEELIYIFDINIHTNVYTVFLHEVAVQSLRLQSFVDILKPNY